jgi:hypothetical protein
MTIYLFIAASFFILGLICVWSMEERFISWIPELAVISMFWPLVIVCRLRKMMEKDK